VLELNDADIIKYNRKAWDRQVDGGQSDWIKPVSHDEIEQARGGEFKLYLTPIKPVPASWFPELTGCKVLCLASGGGQQAPLLAAAGANVTVFDNSQKQLETDEMVAKNEGLGIKTVQGDMRDLSLFSKACFDLIIHPVSNAFVPDVKPVWKEAARVLRSGGLLLSGFTNPVVYLFDGMEMAKRRLIVSHKIPYSPFNDDAKAETELFLKYGEALEFGHSLQDQISGQLDAGFMITGLYEDNNRENAKCMLDDYIPIYLATRAEKREGVK
jgi:2-polyprenyl-3-methyl-5-hydroxy-6-metoxy-1,4-benzoquinol methylase